MGTRFDDQRFAVRKMLASNESMNTLHGELVALFRKKQITLGFSAGLTTAFMLDACEEAVGVGADDSLDLRDSLPPRVGEHKAIGWAARVHEGESVAEVTQGTYSTIETVQQAVDVTIDYIGFCESEDSSPE